MTPRNFLFKVVCGGAGGVGKTTLLHRYLHNEFLTDTALTIGVDFHNKEVFRDEDRVLLTIWDLGGQERFRFFQPQYCDGARAALIFFDITRITTAFEVKDWAEMFRVNASPDIPIILGGTKLDLATPELVEQANDYAKNLIDELGLSCYYTTSSLTGENVEEIFNCTVDLLMAQIKEGDQRLPPVL